MSAIATIGRSTRNFVADAGALYRLGADATWAVFLGPFQGERLRVRLALSQLVRAGNQSLPLVALICALVGMILALQSAYQLRQLGAIDLVPALVGVSLTRELGPLLTAIIVAGRYGSSIAAELGTMKVSQEIDALQVMGIRPTAYLVAPRLLGLIVALPCLTVFADVVGILGGQAVTVLGLGMGADRYIQLTLDSLVLEDIYTGLVKALVFATLIGLVGCHQGLSTRGSAEAVGRSTTSAVVRSIVLIMAADLFVTALFFVKG